MQLTPHFSLAEFTATTYPYSNAPTAAQIVPLRHTAEQLEAVRALLGKPITVNSAFRSAAVNAAAGGVSNSAHMLCYAVDFTCAGFGDPYHVAMKIAESGIRFDQLIHERRTWVHISFDPRYRRQLLTLDAAGYESGILR